MAKLKLGAIIDDKPVKLTVELSAAVHRDLLAYAEVLAHESGQSIADPNTDAGAILGAGPCLWKGTPQESNDR